VTAILDPLGNSLRSRRVEQSPRRRRLTGTIL